MTYAANPGKEQAKNEDQEMIITRG